MARVAYLPGTKYDFWRAQPRQRDFLLRTEDEVLYGGAAGGGKSDALLAFQIRRRLRYRGSKGLYLRKTFADLSKAGAAIDRSKELLTGIAKYDEQRHRWTFPNGSFFEFGYLQHKNDRYHYQSSQYDDICVLRGTPVLMADGSWQAIEQVQPGDYVATLEGPRRVLSTHKRGLKPVCAIQTAYGMAVVSANHKVLLAGGDWACPRVLLSTGCPPSDSTGARWREIPEGFDTLHESRCSGRQPILAPSQRSEEGMVGQDCGALSLNAGSACKVCADGPREVQPPGKWVGRLALLSRVLPSGGASSGHGDVSSAAFWSVSQDSPSGCPVDSDSCDGHTHRASIDVPDNTQQLSDAEAQSPETSQRGDRANTPRYTQRVYVHPYTKELRGRVEDVRHVAACIVPAGEGEVFDLTIEHASHYIVSPGIVTQNCWDELTQFEEDEYLYMLSRCRATVEGIIPLVRAATNPGGIGHAWVKKRFVDSGPPVSTFLLPRVDGQTEERHGCFVPAKLQDNQILMRRDPGYWDRLMALPEMERRALAYGDWDVFVGQFFREWRRDLHTCAPFEISRDWTTRRVSVDWGYGAPWSCHFWVRDEDLWRTQRIHRWYAYREFYGTQIRDDDQAEMIAEAVATDRQRQKREKGPGLNFVGFADPSMWNKKPQQAVSIIDVYHKHTQAVGLGWTPSNNDRVLGWQRVREYLALQEDGLPAVIYFDTCPNAINTIPTLIYDEHNPEDIEQEGNPDDHCADALRYLLMGVGPLELHKIEPVRTRHYGFGGGRNVRPSVDY